MKMHFGGVAVIAVVSLAAYAEENQPTTEDAMTIPSATDREIVAQMHRTRPAADVVPPLAARGAKAPHGSPRNAWRYEFYHGRWWYWGPDDHWAYYDGRRWKTLPARRQDSWMAGANQDRGAGNRSAGPRRSSIGGLSTYGGDDPFETGSATIAGGETDSPVVPGLGESLGGTPGALRSDK